MEVNGSRGQGRWDNDTTEIPAGTLVNFNVATGDVTDGMGI